MKQIFRRSSGETAKSHPLFRMLAMLLVVGGLWWHYQQPQSDELLQVSANEVAEEYAARYADRQMAGRTLEKLAFHQEFSGEAGEAFYVVWKEAGGGMAVEKYHIQPLEEAPGYQFVYKATFEELQLPAAQFFFLQKENGKWLEQ